MVWESADLVLGQQCVADTREQHHSHQEWYSSFDRHDERGWSSGGAGMGWSTAAGADGLKEGETGGKGSRCDGDESAMDMQQLTRNARQLQAPSSKLQAATRDGDSSEAREAGSCSHAADPAIRDTPRS
jgi:hypothetical protein